MTDSEAPDPDAGADQNGPRGVSRRGVLGGLLGATATAGAVTTAALGAKTAPAARATTGSGAAVAADNSRVPLGGSPIIDAPFPDGQTPLQPLRERVLALRDLLVQKQVVDPKLIDVFVGLYEKSVGPRYGAAVVAHVWTDPHFRHAVLNPPPERPFAATTLIADYLRGQPSFTIPETPGTFLGPEGEWLRVVANGVDAESGKRVHNIVACTACSCYPQALLGIQPVWYKSTAYRARTVASPRGVMREFAQAKGPEQVAKLEHYLAGIDELRVWDSNSEVRYLVVPELPQHYQGLGAAELAAKEHELREAVTRNSMVGVEIL